jgi:TRAP-type uncharacterized transport system fused permease subunit
MTDLVHFHVEHPGATRDRWRTVFRPILVIPHAILVGGPLVGVWGRGLRTGVLGLVALTCAFLDWFAILFTRRPIAGLQQLKRLYLGWRARVLAYACFLRDEYPPFGDGQYPAWLELPDEPEQRDLKSVGLRLFLLIPHLVVLFCLFVAQFFVSIAAWLSIAFTRKLSDSLWRFTRDVMSYALRVEAYALLIHDQFPSFSLSAERREPALAGQP